MLEARQKTINAITDVKKYSLSNKCCEKIKGTKTKEFFTHWGSLINFM
jgi:hypothetical protein